MSERHDSDLSEALSESRPAARVAVFIFFVGFLFSHALVVTEIEDRFFESEWSRDQLTYELVGGLTYGVRQLGMMLLAGWLLWRPRRFGLRAGAVLLPAFAFVSGWVLGRFPMTYGAEYALASLAGSLAELGMSILIIAALTAVRRFRLLDQVNEPDAEIPPKRSAWTIRGMLIASAVISIWIAVQQWNGRVNDANFWVVSEDRMIYVLLGSVANAVALWGVGFVLSRSHVVAAMAVTAVTVLASWLIGGMGESVAYGTAEWISLAVTAITTVVALHAVGWLLQAIGLRLF